MAATISTNAVAAFVLAWETAGLNALFRAQRTNPADTDLVLFNRRAKPNTDFPYCVYSFLPGFVTSRMSWERNIGKEVRLSRLTLSIWHRRLDLAGALAERVHDEIGGSIVPKSGDSGCILNIWYVGDEGGRDPDGGEEEWRWMLLYDVMWEGNTNV